MYQLEFAQAYNYSGQDESVVIPITLRSGANEVQVAASVDTGASFCVCRTEVAEDLGLDLASGFRQRFRTANSSFDAYGHAVEIRAFDFTMHSFIYFFAEPSIDRNVLGRTGWLDRVRLGLVHHDCKIYLAPYDSI